MKKNRKNRVFAGVLVVAMLMSVISFTAFATTPTLTMSIDEDMDNGEYKKAVATASNNFAQYSFVDYLDDNEKLYGKVLKLDFGSGAASGDMSYSIGPSSGAYVRINGNSDANKTTKFVETSFDIALYGTGRPFNVYLGNGDDSTYITQLHWDGDGKFIVYVWDTAQNKAVPTRIGSYSTTKTKMTNVKVVNKLVWDAEKSASNNTITGIYLDGVLQTHDGTVTYPLVATNEGVTKYSQIKFLMNNKDTAGERGAYIDNVSVIHYESETENSPVADFSELKAEIVSACAILDDTQDYASADLTAFEAEVDEAVAVHNNIKATQAAVDEALAALKAAKAELRTLKTSDIYNEDFTDSTLVTNLTTTGTYTIVDYDGDAQSEIYGNAAKVTVSQSSERAMSVNTTSDALKNNVIASNSTALGTFSFDFKPFGTFVDMSMPITVGSEKDANNVLKLNFKSDGTLSVATQLRVSNVNSLTTYPGGSTTPVSDELTIAEGIDYGRMHNVTVVYGYTGRSEAVTALKTDILGIYLDGKKLDYINNSEQSIYPLGMPQSRINRANFLISDRDARYGNYGYWVDNVVAGLYSGGVVSVMKQSLKSAITESCYVFDSLSEDKKQAVTAKLAEAKTLYDNPAAGQVECDAMAAELEQLLLPSLETYIEKISIPATVSANAIVLPDFDGVTTSVSSNPDIIANDGTVTQPTDKAVDVVLTVTLTRGAETASKEFKVTVLPRLAVEINSVKFTDASGDTVYGQTNGGTLSKITVVKNTDEAAKIIAAVYADDVLMNTKVIDATDGETELNLALGENGAETEIRFFVWSELNMLNPLQRAIVQPETTTVYVLGDSIYAEQPASSIPEGQAGIGKMLKNNYDTDSVTINNMAYCGSSSKGFADSYRLNTELNRMSVGDYAIISFAHNDEKADLPANYSPLDTKTVAPFAAGTYQGNLERYVKEIREQGATPILITSLPRFKFGEDGLLSETHGGYIQAMKDVAKATDCIIIDLNGYAKGEINKLGETNAKKYYNGDDTTHLSEEGAQWLADYISDQMEALGLSISKYRE